MASYAGVSLGYDLSMEAFGNPRKEQVDQYFGVDGYEVKDGGSAGYRIAARGVLAGYVVGLAGLAAVIAQLEALRDGRDHLLIDTLGRSWPYARLREFRPAGEIRTTQDGFCEQGYTAVWESWI